MPRIPTYDTPQAETRALPGVRQSSVASPALFSGSADQQVAIGRGLMSAGSQVDDIAVRMQDRENADMLFRAETALKDDYLKYETSVRQRKGQNAWGTTAETEQWFADQEKKHSDILQNDVQRKLFGQTVTKLRQAAMGSIANYESGERHRSIEESAGASIVGSINLAAANAAEWYLKPPAPVQPPKDDATATTTTSEEGTPVNAPGEATATRDPIIGVKADIVKRVQVLANLNGWTPERKSFEEGKYLTNLHKQVIQSLTDKDPSKAREYFEANKAEINGADHDQIGKVLKVGETKQAGFEFAERTDIQKLSLEDQLLAARDFYKNEPEKREAAVHELKTRAAEGEVIRQRNQRAAGDDAWKTITNGGGFKDIPSSTWATMGGEEQKQVLSYLEAKTRRADAEARGDAKAGQDDIANLDKVERMIEQGDITERGQLARYEPFFSKSTLKTLTTKIDKRSTVPPTDIRRVFEERKGAKVSVGKMGEGDRAEWMAFQNYILENVKETKRPEDIDVWADRWFLKGYGKDDSVFKNDPDTYGEARAKGRKDFVVSTPEAMRGSVDQALDILQKNGVAMPKDKTLARDEFYTKHGLEADRWAAAHSVQNSPEMTAAYALLKQNGKPVTPANLQYVLEQLKK